MRYENRQIHLLLRLRLRLLKLSLRVSADRVGYKQVWTRRLCNFQKLVWTRREFFLRPGAPSGFQSLENCLVLSGYINDRFCGPKTIIHRLLYKSKSTMDPTSKELKKNIWGRRWCNIFIYIYINIYINKYINIYI